MPSADSILINARIYTCDPDNEWADALAVSGGVFVAVGATEEVMAHAGPDTEIIDAAGAMVIPGLCDVHIHLALGGGQAAFELPIAPTATADDIYAAITDWASTLGPDEWVVGGIVGSTVRDNVATTDALARLDAAAGGRPVLLRDDSMHNRWVNSAALAAMGVSHETPDPDGGTYVRDAEGNLTGVLWELASQVAETAFANSVADPAARMRTAVATAATLCNQFGITTAQEAATMHPQLEALRSLEQANELTLRVSTSTPMRPFLGPGVTGIELATVAEEYRSELVDVSFVKVVLDGVPVTRTSAMLSPYLSTGCCSGEEFGECLYTLDELVATLEEVVTAGRGAKIHAAGDASTKLALDAVEIIRERHGDGPRFQIAHTTFVRAEDLERFARLGVVADASPYIWYPGVILESIVKQVPGHLVDTSWPLKDLLALGVNVSAGSDWPCALPTPDPWTGMEALITRQAPGASEGEPALNPAQRLSVAEALAALTIRPAQAMGLDHVAGTIAPTKSADYVVLDRNLFEVPADTIHATVVEQTWFRGTKVYQR
ncbi:amidohydrolase [Nocardia sp. R16R-3T]